ncbi:MAG: glycosyltransferase, partial [Hyphomicrobiales bacterium]|nr:glycosyltransferase [Hyphomicrobiales bacterium]
SGSTSFGRISEVERRERLAALVKKHPDYEMCVQSYVQANFGRVARARLDLYRLAAMFRGNCILAFTHGQIGGVTTYINKIVESGISLLMIDFSGNRIRIRAPERLFQPNLDDVSLPRDLALLEIFVEWLQPTNLQIHSFVGADWVTTETVINMLIRRNAHYDVFVHDYSFWCHRNHMFSIDQKFCAMQSVDDCVRCARDDPSNAHFVDPRRRRATFGKLLKNAASCVTPSEDATNRMSREFPGIEFSVVPHDPPIATVAANEIPRDVDEFRVALLGAVGPHKGSRILYALAQDVLTRKLPLRYEIIGYSDMTKSLMEVGVNETGPYKTDMEAVAEIRRFNPHAIFVSSIVPETFCFTLSMAMRLGSRIVSFDFGAQGERVSRYDRGHCVELDLATRPSELNDRILQICVDSTKSTF